MNGSALFSNNASGKYLKKYFKEKCFVYESSRGKLDDEELKRIIMFINSIDKHINLPIIINLGRVTLSSKIPYILLEYICYYLMKEKSYRCCVIIDFAKRIYSYDAKSSPLFLLTYNNVIGNPRRFNEICTQYIKRFESYYGLYHIRKIIKKEECGTDAGSKLYTTIQTTLKNQNLNIEQTKQICEVVTELMDNSGEHGIADCLMDIDITPDHRKENEDGTYCGVNIVVFDFATKKIGENISEFFKSQPGHNEWYEKLNRAYENHKRHWDDTYNEQDFFIMSAFQHKISTRKSNYLTGGTGLTKLIRALEYQADAYDCFIWTGYRKMEFWHELLVQDDFEWVGFNKFGDFFSEPPNTSILKNSTMYFPGTAYNLSFVLRKE